MTSIVGKCDRALWKSITNNRTMMPWVTQQQLQYTTGGRYQLPVLVPGDMTQKAEGKLETLLNKFLRGRLRRSSFGRKSVKTAGWGAHSNWASYTLLIGLSLCWQWFRRQWLEQWIIAAVFLVDTVTEYIYFHAVNTDKTAYMNSTSLPQILCSARRKPRQITQLLLAQ